MTDIDVYTDAIRKSFYRTFDKDILYPSEIGTCVRRSYFFRTEPNVLIISNDLLDSGRNIHDAIQDVLEDNLNCQTEVELRTEINGIIISGRADAMCNGDLLEFKVVNYIPPQPKSYHLQQVALYYKALLDLGIQPQNVYIFYIRRDTLEVKGFKLSEEQLKEGFRKAVEYIESYKYVLETGDFKKFKPAEPSFCKYCQFRDKCNMSLSDFSKNINP